MELLTVLETENTTISDKGECLDILPNKFSLTQVLPFPTHLLCFCHFCPLYLLP